MSEPVQDDLSNEADKLVEPTKNGQKANDPDNSDVSQDPNFLPSGTESAAAEQGQ